MLKDGRSPATAAVGAVLAVAGCVGAARAWEGTDVAFAAALAGVVLLGWSIILPVALGAALACALPGIAYGAADSGEQTTAQLLLLDIAPLVLLLAATCLGHLLSVGAGARARRASRSPGAGRR